MIGHLITLMKQQMRYTILTLMSVFAGCLPEVETIDPSTIVEWENYTSSDGLAGNRINSISSDSKGNLWLGTNNGASNYDGTNFTNYKRTDGLVNNFVTSIVEFEPDVTYFGTDGGLSILDHGSWSSISSIQGIPFGVLSMGIDSDGFIWFGTDVFGLLLTDGESLFQLWDDKCSECNEVNYIYRDAGNTMWFGTSGGLKALSGNSITFYTTSDGLPDNHIQSVYEDNWGTLWVGTFNGLCRRISSGFEIEGLYNSAGQNWTYTINQDMKRDIWFGSIGNGLIYFNGSSMRTNPESLLDERISTISSFKDKDGALWFGTFEGGLWKYIPK